VQHLQISDNQSINDNFASETHTHTHTHIYIYLIYNFTCLLDILRTLSQLYLLYTKQLFPATCYCAAEFYTFLLAININIEPIDMVTSLLLYLHHAVTALILILSIVVTEVLI